MIPTLSCLLLLLPQSGSMPLDELARGLAAHPPRLGDPSDRLPYIKALDGWATRPDTVYWDGNPRTANREFHAYYRRAIERALTEAEKTKVTSRAVVWKLYSSGFLVKTPRTVFAFDAVEGPFKDIRKSPEDVPEFIFHWTPAMRKKFAGLVDALFITHRHYDHTSYALARALAARGKTVVVPKDIREIWKAEPFAGKLRVLEGGKDHKIGRLTVRTFDAVQAMKRDGRNNYLISPTDPKHNVYLVRAPNGMTVLHNGDNRGRDFTPWLGEAFKDGWEPEVWFKIMGWPRDVISSVERFVKPVLIPGHEYEMGHKPKYGANTLARTLTGYGRQRARENRFVVLTWGEKIAFD